MARASEPAHIGGTIGAFLTTLAANVRLAEERGFELEPEMISPAEVRLAEALHVIGLDPVQQHPIGQYAADFYFPEVRLCVEVDGIHHADRKPQDAARDAALWKKGIKTMRIPAAHVRKDADQCARAIRYAIDRIQIGQLEGAG